MLEELRVGRWRGSDLRMVRGAKRLSVVRVAGRRQAGSLMGVESCRSVTDFMSVDYLRDLEALAAMPRPRELRIIECPISARDNEILHALPDRIRVERVDVRPEP